MATPTDYDLTYEDPCSAENQDCDGGECANKKQITARPTEFCREIIGDSTLSIAGLATLGSATVRANSITVGGLVFRPIVINTDAGSHLVLAVY